MSDALKRLRTPIDLDSMPKWRQRVEIAKDVIAALDAKVLTAYAGNYIRVEGVVKGDLRSQLPGKQCQVCALGACFLAEVGRRNDFEASEDFEADTDDMRKSTSKTFKRLAKVFTPEQLVLIEQAFEYWGSPQDRLLTSDEKERVFQWRSSLWCADNDSTLRAIMQNIIDNKGTFIP